MSKWFVCIATAVVMTIVAASARADATLAFSFETIATSPPNAPGPDGFFGLGAAVSQDTIGATHLSHSMKYAAGNPGFVGARTETLIPLELNNPPGVDHVLFDMFIPQNYPGNFADIGITIFGHDIDNLSFGNQKQFTDTVSIAALGAGQHNNLRIDLDSEFFSGESFNEIFGDDITDLDVASAFQFYISKDGGVPVTVYIDNVRLVVPEPATFALFGVGAVVIGGLSRRRRAG